MKRPRKKKFCKKKVLRRKKNRIYLNKRRKKIITIPLSGDVDVTRVLPLIDHPIVQRLRRVSQLGPVAFTFPGATHTRFEHSLGTYQKQIQENQRWIDEGFSDKNLLWTFAVYALLHDIGHPPLSHVTEYLLGKSNDDYGAEIICELKKEIELCDVDFRIVKELFDKVDPMRSIVHDKNLGTDKLDYLDRDAFHTNFGGRPGIDRVFSYIYWHDVHGLVLDAKSAKEAKKLQRDYMYMYSEVYLRKASLIAQRFIQKALQYLFELGFSKDKIWRMDDVDFEIKLRSSEHPGIQRILENYRARCLPKLFMSLRSEGYEMEDRVANKPIKIFSLKESLLEGIVKNFTAEFLMSIEASIADILSLPRTDVLVVPSQGGFRFVPKDIKLIDGANIIMMSERFPKHFESMKEESKGYLSVRICAIGDRRRLIKHAEEIKELLLDRIS